MARNSIASVLIILVVCLMSCSGSANNPVSVSPDSRFLEVFDGGAFPMQGDGVFAPFYGCDVATCKSLGGDGYPVVLDGDYFSINISVQSPAAGNYATAFWTWLSSASSSAIFDDGTFGLAPDANVYVKFAKVDAMYFAAYDQVIAAVAFNWKIGSNGNWELGVITLRWDGDDFDQSPLSAPSIGRYFPYTNDVEYGHDIAFHPTTGDIYVVYTHVTGIGESELLYYVLNRADPENEPDTWALLDAEGPYWAVYNPAGQAWWYPSIDIGKLDAMPPDYGAGEIFVAVVASCYDWDSDELYRVAGNYWAPSVYEDGYNDQTANTMDWQNDDFTENNAGMPVIDISPDRGTGSHFFAMVYVQEVNASHVYEVWEVDNRGGVEMEIVHTTALNHCQALPTIAYNYTYNLGDDVASVSFIENETAGAQGDNWRVQACLVNLNDDAIVGSTWGSLNTAITGDYTLNTIATNKAATGCSIALTVEDDYWLIFSDTTDYDCTDLYAKFDDSL